MVSLTHHAAVEQLHSGGVAGDPQPHEVSTELAMGQVSLLTARREQRDEQVAGQRTLTQRQLLHLGRHLPVSCDRGDSNN
jgi:hypothetical protein